MGVAVGFAGLMASLSGCQVCTVGVLNNIQTSPNPPGAFWDAKESGKGTSWGKQEWRLVGGGRGRYRVCNTERESMGNPGANKSHDIIAWQGARSGVVRSRGREREEGEKGAPTVTHSGSRGPSSGMDKSRTMRPHWMVSQIPQEKNKSPVGKGEGEGEMEKKTERDGEKKGDP